MHKSARSGSKVTLILFSLLFLHIQVHKADGKKPSLPIKYPLDRVRWKHQEYLQ